MLNIIVPYRNRERQKGILTKSLHDFLSQNLEDTFHIYVIEQSNEKEFNKGCLLNAGFLEVNKVSNNQNDYLCLHDVDVIPKTTEANYQKPPKDCIIHPYGHWHCLSNIIVMNSDTYIKMNGFSNKYWKWGYEDTEFLLRARYNKVEILRENFTERFRSKIYQELDKQDHKDMVRKTKELSAEVNKILFESTIINPEKTRNDGLNTVKYKVLKREKHEFYTQINISVENENKNYYYMKELADYHKYLMFHTSKRNWMSALGEIRYLVSNRGKRNKGRNGF